MARTRPRKRALQDDSQSSRPNDRANKDSYRPQPPLQPSKRSLADLPPWRRGIGDQKEDSRSTMKKPAGEQLDRHTSHFADLTLDDDDVVDAMHPSRRNLTSNKFDHFSLPHRPAAGSPYIPPTALTHKTAAGVPYKPPTASSRKSARGPRQKLASVHQSRIEPNVVEELDGEIRWRIPDSKVTRKETFASSAQQSQTLRQTWDSDHKKQGSANEDSKSKKWTSMNEESKDNKERWAAISRPGPPAVMFTLPEAFAALKHGPKPVPYYLPAGERLSYPVKRSYHLGAMRYGVNGTLLENPAHKNHIAFKPTNWHDFQPDIPYNSRYDD